MKRKWTRRQFLETSLDSSIVIGGGALAGAVPKCAQAQAKSLTHPGFDQHERAVLRAAMDEIIPAAEGMPAASEVGAVQYLDRIVRQTPSLMREFARVLAQLEEVSQKRFTKDFLSLSRADRVAVLAALEKQDPQHIFNHLRDFVYEAYYTQPKVWKLIGYEFYATSQAGPRMKPFDESVLAEVRKMPKLYRQVG